MRTILFLLAVFLFAASPCTAQDSNLIGMTSNGNGWDIVTVRTTDGKETVISSDQRRVNSTGHGTYNPANNTFSYTYHRDLQNTPRIRTVDVATGNVVSDVPLASGRDVVSTSPLNSGASNLTGVEDRLAGTETRLDLVEQDISILSKRIDQVGALSAAIDIQRPIAGKSFRIGADVGVFRDQAAVGISASGVSKSQPIDFGVGLATTGSETMGKASVGWNW